MTLAGWAAAQCTAGPDTSQVTIPDYLAVYYLHFTSLPDEDEVRFYGGVCVTAVGGEWTVIADEVTVVGLSGELGLRAAAPMLYWGDLRMQAANLAATTETLVLQQATIDGPDFSGDATTMVLDLFTGAVVMTEFTLAGVAFAVSGESAELIGQTLSVTNAEVTTCIGVEQTPYAIQGVRATVDLTARSVELQGGVLRLGALRIGLRPRIELTEESLERFTLPLQVSNVPDGGDPARPGSGVGVRLVGLPLGDEGDATLDIGATGLDAPHTPGAVALVRLAVQGAQQRVNATFGVEGGLPLLDVRAEREVTPWLDATVSLHSGAAAGETPYHEARVGLNAEADVPIPGPPSLTVTAEAFAAATALASIYDLATPLVFGPRLGAAAGFTAATGRTAAGSFSVRTRAEATYYPSQGALQWAVRLNPTWRLDVAPLALQLGYDTWLTNSASPFEGLDRRRPLARLTASARAAGQLATWGEDRRVTGSAGVRATHDGLPTSGNPAGLNAFVADAGLTYETGVWAFDASATARLAGVLDPAPSRDASVTYVLEARRSGWPVLQEGVEPHEQFAVRAEAIQGLLADDPGLRRLDLSVAVPLAFENLELRPSIGFDVAPLIESGLPPILSLHALDVTVITCCGSLTVGYTNKDGAVTASFAIDLERRPMKKE